MSDPELYRLMAALWTVCALYAAILAGRLHRHAIEDEQARKKNGLRKILSQGLVRLYRILFAKALLFLAAGILALVPPLGSARVLLAAIFITNILLLVYLLNRAARQDRIVRHYDLREDRADARMALAEDRADARADRAEDRADAREERRQGGSGL